MGQRFLIDTNIVIDVLGGAMPDSVRQEVLRIPLIVSAVTYIEVLGWYRATPSQLAILQSFLNAAEILPISHPVMVKTVAVRQQRKIGLGDAIIAATALVHNMTILTRNTSDFQSIQDLSVVNPWGVK